MPPKLSKTMSLTADHMTYTVDRLCNENTNVRLWALQKQYPTSESEYQSALALAQYWYFNKTLGCVYNAAVQRKTKSIKIDDDSV